MMQRSILGLGLILLSAWAVSCSSALTRRAAVEAPAQHREDGPGELGVRDDQAALRGMAKIQESDCTSCHALERKSVGPSYAAIAEKYEPTDAVVKMLAHRIISGSTGAWGEIPMTPHPELSTEDAEQMVKFVFTLKK
jgi:cytochrome c